MNMGATRPRSSSSDAQDRARWPCFQCDFDSVNSSKTGNTQFPVFASGPLSPSSPVLQDPLGGGDLIMQRPSSFLSDAWGHKGQNHSLFLSSKTVCPLPPCTISDARIATCDNDNEFLSVPRRQKGPQNNSARHRTPKRRFVFFTQNPTPLF